MNIINADFEKNEEENTVSKYVLLDNNCRSIIKYEISKLLENCDTDLNAKITHIKYYLESYKCYEVIELFFLFVNENTNKNQLEHNLVNYFFIALSDIILDYDYEWINVKNNQFRLLNLLKIIQYVLFEKYKSINKKKINTTRRNFAIIIFELSKTDFFEYKNEVKEILDNSIVNNINSNYEIYIYKLSKLHSIECKHEKHSYYQLLITRSKNSYNTFFL